MQLCEALVRRKAKLKGHGWLPTVALSFFMEGGGFRALSPRCRCAVMF